MTTIEAQAPIEVLPRDEYNQVLVDNAHPSDWENPTPDGRYNLVVIGGGSAGLVAAVGTAGIGGKVALIESHLLGGDCLNVGCVPSKTVIRSAKVFGDIRKARAVGVEVPEGTKANFAEVMQRMRRIRADISHHDSAQRFDNAGVDVYLGFGRFAGPNKIEVVDRNGKVNRTLEFKKAVIATGSRPAVIPTPGLKEAGYLTNIELFELTEQPDSMAVVGAGPIGSELAQAFARLGTKVTLFDIAPQILPREDREAAAIVEKALLEDGVTLNLGHGIKRVEKVEDSRVIYYEVDGKEESIVVDEILLAVGRKPNIEGLNLEAAGIEYTKRGLVVNDRLETTNKNVYGGGDVAVPLQFTHVADATARIVIQNALFFGRKKYSDLVIPWVTFTDPEIAHVGMYEHEAKEKGIAVDVYKVNIDDTDRGRADSEAGFVRIITKKGSDQILGATIVARHAGEMISEVTVMMVNGLGLEKLTNVIHPYPTQAEAIRKAADAYRRTRLTPTVANIFKRFLAWTR